MSGRRLKVAAAQYPIDWLEGWQAYEAKLTGWIDEAVAAGAQLLVFPEYGAMELASLFPEPVPGDLVAQLPAVASLEARVVELHRALARRHGVYILGASLPAEAGAGRYHNRAWLYGPDGRAAHQDKIVMTRFEREDWGVSGGSALRLFDTALGRLGVCICYDVQFPLLGRGLVEAGAELILVPSVTETLHGYWRVRTGAQARALENQCHVVHAPVVGEAPWSPAVDVSRGAAAVYGPPDKGFPPDGIVAIGALDRPGWIHAEIDLDLATAVRVDGMVLNHRHWPEQANATIAPVELASV